VEFIHRRAVAESILPQQISILPTQLVIRSSCSALGHGEVMA
jgi:hypothetical protein